MNAFGEGAVLGCDFTGIVEEVGKTVTSVQVGDRIAGLAWGGEYRGNAGSSTHTVTDHNPGEVKGLGAFSELTIAEEKICFKVPESISSANAATVPLAAATAWLALFSRTCLDIQPAQGKQPNPILIWGGSCKFLLCHVTT